MTTATEQEDCAKRCWLIGLAVAVVLALLLMLFGVGFLMSLFIGILAFVAVGEALLYFWCREAPVVTRAPAAPVAAPVESQPMVEAKPAPEAKVEPEAKAEPATVQSDVETPAAAVVKATTALPGQAELAERKGSWKYEGGAAVPAAAAAEGRAPGAVDAARGGKADNLKKIKGVGPKLEGVLNGVGVYHFDQIAAWSEADVAWADENLVGFKGRVSRDDWVAQAKILASGGETEFSKRTKP
ncbi:endonuclease [Albibacillus kandeliae]|uniref:endonuclease n=1 Tax=Albibacillus kandeliae TaxID=2174228 RepID=UPI000D69A799|nr:endonuclease [Albibacillus kandeliae]